MHLLGLDFGSKTGVAYGNAGAPASRITLETWALPTGDGENVGPFMHTLRSLLDDRLMRGVEAVCFEAPYIARFKRPDGKWQDSPDQIRRAYGAAAICEQACFARGIPCIEIVTVTLKKDFAGSGKAKKPQMIRAAKQRGFKVSNDHEADAAGCFVHAVEQFAPAHAALYSPLFSRGSAE